MKLNFSINYGKHFQILFQEYNRPSILKRYRTDSPELENYEKIRAEPSSNSHIGVNEENTENNEGSWVT
jgi:hypothetical protein